MAAPLSICTKEVQRAVVRFLRAKVWKGLKFTGVYLLSMGRGRLSQGVLLLHDSARPHSAARTKETLQELKYEALDHLTYSPDIAPPDFHLFGPLRETLRGR
jgi:hypothetical protein